MITNTEEIISPTGKLIITVTNPKGEIVDYREVTNLVVTTGKNWIAGRLKDTLAPHTIPGEMTHMGIGIGATATALGDTSLGSQVARVALTTSGGTVAGNIITYECTFLPNTPGSNAAVTEAGIFTASSSGTMLCRTTFAVVNKTTADTMTIVWAVTVA